MQSGCICPGYIVTLECTISGGFGGSTVWQGSAFDCPRCEILLRHSQFELGTAVGECNDGAITGYGRQTVDNHSYTSQLNVTFTRSLNGKTVECVYDNGTTNVIGRSSIDMTTGRCLCQSSKFNFMLVSS